jgi:VWFA-related protein
MCFTLRRTTRRTTAQHSPETVPAVLPGSKSLGSRTAERTGPQRLPRSRGCLAQRPKTMVTAVGFGLLAAAVAAAQTATGGQQPSGQSAPPGNGQPATTVSVQVNVVNVLATVRDKHGKIVKDLTKDDFIMTEDGRPQTIRYFTKESDLPLTLGLLVDTSLSQRRVLDQEKSASHGFLDQMLRVDKDQAFIIHFDREVELLQDLTSSRDKLEVALEQLQTPQFTQTSGNDPSSSDPNSGRGSRRMGGAGTLLYDAVYLASDELMKKQQGRKALVVLSDGVDHGSKETLESAIATAQRSDTVVYSILFKDDERDGGGGFGGPRIGMGGGGMGGGMGRHGGGRGYPREEQRPDGKKVLERISKETGGRMFEVSKKDPIDQIYDQIGEELRSQYSLGYTPDRAAADGPLYRKIQLTTKQSGLVVQTREGYYADH